MRRLGRAALALVSLAAVIGVLAPGAIAAHRGGGGSAPPFVPRQEGKAGGIVPSLAYFSQSGANTPVDRCPASGPAYCGSGPLLHHNASTSPVMLTNKTYAIYWQPAGWATFPAGYRTKIDQYLADVAHDSFARSNIYATDTQLFDSIGGTHNIAYDSTFAGSILDTGALPASGCTDTVPSTTVCLSDAQLRTKINAVVAAHAWPRGLGTMYFLFTPYGVGSSLGSSDAYTGFCAYHSYFGLGAGTTIYANQPFTKGVSYDGVPSHLACEAWTSDYPNGASTAADPTISVVSHEHNEAITDPKLNAWYDTMGFENGDKCAWTYGAVAGALGSRYNQTVNGHHYMTQLEWNQAGSNCVAKMPALAPTISGFTPSSGKTRTLVTITGNHLEQATSVKIGLLPMLISSNTAKQIKAYVWDFATSGKIRVTNAGGNVLSLGTFTVSFGISSILPQSAPAFGSVVINGTGFNALSVVKFNGTTASRVVNSSTKITATVPLLATTGKISVTNTFGVLGTVYSYSTFTKL